MKVGVISDTHGLVRPAALAALRGCKRILHAGDIGSPEIIEALQTLAPVSAIRGNNDTDAWAKRIPETLDVRIEKCRIHLVHRLQDLAADDTDRFDVVISGHSHRPLIERRGTVLYLNPGSAGPRRFKLPIALAILTVNGTRARARLVELPS